MHVGLRRTQTPEELAYRAAEVSEKLVPAEGIPARIDALYADLRSLEQGGALDARVFREVRHRLWMSRERVCEALLPEAQRARERGL